ncbi:TRAP transporter small permease subunit [Desulfogranum marinum]|uniref:TRAP transporter small permease subunit n=1 Tax=Desulfogranum marinum TaxID=453220 RepID=UPI0029C7CBD9|nr:TRAP transporter small permease subunit [Desulfogranum marinum]
MHTKFYQSAMLNKVELLISRVVDFVGRCLAILLLLMVLNVSYDVMMRYLFHASSVGMQEMEWHLFAVIILFGVGVALKEEGHVRVDFLYDRLSKRKKAVINVLGTIFLLLPLALLILFGSIDFVLDAYNSGEISEDPGGLPLRWIVKCMIPVAFGFLLFAAVGYILQNVEKYRSSK